MMENLSKAEIMSKKALPNNNGKYSMMMHYSL